MKFCYLLLIFCTSCTLYQSEGRKDLEEDIEESLFKASNNCFFIEGALDYGLIYKLQEQIIEKKIYTLHFLKSYNRYVVCEEDVSNL